MLMLMLMPIAEPKVKEPYKEPVTGKSGVGADQYGMSTVHPKAGMHGACHLQLLI